MRYPDENEWGRPVARIRGLKNGVTALTGKSPQ
jgi:hypothetical protein